MDWMSDDGYWKPWRFFISRSHLTFLGNPQGVNFRCANITRSL